MRCRSMVERVARRCATSRQPRICELLRQRSIAVVLRTAARGSRLMFTRSYNLVINDALHGRNNIMRKLQHNLGLLPTLHTSTARTRAIYTVQRKYVPNLEAAVARTPRRAIRLYKSWADLHRYGVRLDIRTRKIN